MANGVRVLQKPIAQAAGKGQSVSGVTLDLEIFGKGPGKLTKGSEQPVKLTLCGAFLKKARDEAKDKLSFQAFASVSGKIFLKGAQPVIRLDAAVGVSYTQSAPKTATYRVIELAYAKRAFEGVPSVPAVKPTEPPKELPALLQLRLPEEPKGMKFLVTGAILEIGGAKSSDVEQNDMLDVPLVPIQLKLTKVDHHFAPGSEKLEVKYTVGGLMGSRVQLEVSSKHYTGSIFKRLLTKAELADGALKLEWDGKCNAPAGELKDRWLSPLFGPYELKLSDSAKHETKKEFHVLYHSVEVKLGPWTADGKEPPKASKKDWAQYKLNQLGYFAGPVGHDFDDYLQKAVIRYKANHLKMREKLYSSYTDAITPTLEAALSAGDNKRAFIAGDPWSNPKKTAKIFVEAITYERISNTTTEFGQAKAPFEKQRINRPLLPLLVDIYLLTKDPTTKKAKNKEAVGAVRVNVKFTDIKQDLTKQVGSSAAQPSKSRAYIEKALKLKGGRSATVGDNCHKDFAGVRDAAASDYETAFVDGTKYEPFDVKKDAGNKVCYALAHNDPAKHKDRLGQAGFLFRPSYVAGDAYQLEVELDFTGLPNAADLDKAHGTKNPKKRIRRQTGIFEIWRTAKVAAAITWPTRTGSRDWAGIRAEFGRAYIDLDVSSVDVQPVKTFLTEADYKTIVAAKTSHAAATVSLLPDCAVGVALPGQGADTAANYIKKIRTFVYTNYMQRISAPVAEKITESVRKKHPTGFVVIEYLTHKPLNIQTAPPANTTLAKTNFITWSVSQGLPDSTVLADQKDPDKVYYVVGHEMGHNFWLLHWENANDTWPNGHDTKDHNCIMSYSSSSSGFAHQAPGKFTPHFCGQCNLKLRGWDVDAAAIPASS